MPIGGKNEAPRKKKKKKVNMDRGGEGQGEKNKVVGRKKREEKCTSNVEKSGEPKGTEAM